MSSLLAGFMGLYVAFEKIQEKVRKPIQDQLNQANLRIRDLERQLSECHDDVGELATARGRESLRKTDQKAITRVSNDEAS